MHFLSSYFKRIHLQKLGLSCYTKKFFLVYIRSIGGENDNGSDE